VRLQQLTPKARYAPRGRRAVAAGGKRVKQNMISALANGGELWFSLFDGRFTAKVFIACLERLIPQHEGRKVFLICDNHSSHRAQAVKTWVARRAERIELHFLPAYRPELNPDEYLNRASSATCASYTAAHRQASDRASPAARDARVDRRHREARVPTQPGGAAPRRADVESAAPATAAHRLTSGRVERGSRVPVAGPPERRAPVRTVRPSRR
jgi:transposase